MDSLYEHDFALWSKQQGEALRAAGRHGSNAAIDYDKVAEEIESLGRSERRTLASPLRTVIEHLVKLEASPAVDPRADWIATILRTREEIAGVLRDSPSLRREAPDIVREEHRAARSVAVGSMRARGERALIDPGAITYDETKVTGDWLPSDT